ncbi:hypothetical protein HPB50_016330 [Hyalomma asiaticum]|uniref:Uncharacterized protein n=1 Tax=Hyalomma asiaticum TaxID=266040 RepID=A0ACB7SRE7_HYAAI|nr:hypothetical protein HPB50_016330 [Hyalomma asiaticum]
MDKLIGSLNSSAVKKHDDKMRYALSDGSEHHTFLEEYIAWIAGWHFGGPQDKQPHTIQGCDTRGRQQSPNGHFFSILRIVENQCERSKVWSMKRHSLWLARIKRADLDIENPNLRVCGMHFITGKPAKLFRRDGP